MLLESQMQF